MTDRRDRLMRAAERFGQPITGVDDVRSRAGQRAMRRRALTVAVAIAVALAGIGVVLEAVRPTQSAPGTSPTPSAEPALGSWRPMFQDHFSSSEPPHLWFVTSTPTYSTTYVEGTFRFVLRRPFDWRARAAGGSDALDEVRIGVTSTTPTTDAGVGGDIHSGYQGVICVTSTTPLAGYIVAVDPSDGAWIVQRKETGPPANIGRGTFARTWAPAEPRRIVATCRVHTHRTIIGLTVGEETVTVFDHTSLGPFRGPGMYVASRGTGVTAASFDDLRFDARGEESVVP